MSLIRRGRCWVFGDDLAIDGDIMPLEFAIRRELDPEVLAPHVLGSIDPVFARSVQPGDLVVAGRRFGQGNPHIQGFLGLRGLGVSLLAESIPHGAFRNAINAGLLFLNDCVGLRDLLRQGDLAEVDYRSGRVENLTRGQSRHYAPLPPELLAIIEQGGWWTTLKTRLAAMEPTAGSAGV